MRGGYSAEVFIKTNVGFIVAQGYSYFPHISSE